MKPLIKIQNVKTPYAVRRTGEFKVQVFKEYDASTGELSDEIIRGS